MQFIPSTALDKALQYPRLIQELRRAFQSEYIVPPRHHHSYQSPKSDTDNTLLLMPAWQAGQQLGVKLVTVTPANSKRGLAGVQGVFVLFDTASGSVLAVMDAQTLTSKRTAATSALAADYLSRADSEVLLVAGTGSLALQLIRAHASIRPIKKVLVWGRNFEKAKRLVEPLEEAEWIVLAAPKLEEAVAQADIISCATMSKEPLFSGRLLKPGQHLDLVGSYRSDMREADDEAIRQARLFVDTKAACSESGDIYIPLQKGIIKRSDIEADLFDLCRGSHPGRKNREAISLFKSVGHALQDLAAAQLAYRLLTKF